MADREPLLNALRTMPEEAYSWLNSACATMGHVWPSGTGGFHPDAQAAIAKVRQLADAYMTEQMQEAK